MRKLYLFFMMLGSLSLRAETINGNCVVLQQPFGDELFSINPGTEVDCSPANKGWCYIYVRTWVEKRMVYDREQLLANARLRNNSGKTIGRSKITFTPGRTLSENDTAYLLELCGYIEASCIEDTSIVEHELEEIFRLADSLPDKEQLTQHLNHFNYKSWIGRDGFESYLLTDKSFGPNPAGIRMAIICEKNKVVAVLHGRKLVLKKFEAHVQQTNYGIYFLKAGSEGYKARFQQAFQSEIDTEMSR